MLFPAGTTIEHQYPPNPKPMPTTFENFCVARDVPTVHGDPDGPVPDERHKKGALIIRIY